MKTKEKILHVSLDLFASDGYEAVSVQNIADRLGITKGALYRHYKNKRDIFDTIVEQMRLNKFERARYYDFENPAYRETDPIEIMTRYVKEEFDYWTKDKFASDFRKLLTLEQYRDWEMAYLYQSYIAKGAMDFIEDFFSRMMMDRVLLSGNPRKMAMDLYAPAFMMICIYDVAEDKGEVDEMLREHLIRFLKKR